MTDIWNLPNNISSIYIGQKEIQSIVQTSDSTVLYQKSQSHTYVLTVQLSSNTIYTDGNTVISGVLTDNGSAMANETITIYDGNTSLGTCTTDNNGAYSKTLSGFNSGSHTLKASHTNVDSSTVSLTVNNHSYSLTATLGSASIYTDGSTTISGKLTLDGSPSPYQTLILYDGNSVLETFYTDVQGNYSRTLSGLSVGTHTLKVSHSNVNSSNVTLTVNNHTYAISVSANPVTISSGQSSIIFATLTKDSSAYSGQTVTFTYNGNSYTSTTDSNGVATYTYTGTGQGNVTITASSNGVNNTVTITDNPQGGSPTSIILTGTSNVLSYTNSESSTLTATVLDSSNNPCSGETVVFKKGLTTLDTKTTDSNGQCTYTYNSQGNGDVTLKAICGSLEQTYNIEDCDYTMISDTVVSTSSGDKNFLQYTVESDFILTADYYPTDTWEWFMVKDVNMAIVGVFSSSYDKSSYFGITNLGYNGWKSITIKLENGILTFTYGSTTVTKDVSSYTTPFLWNFIINRANTRFKNFKLKKLNYVSGITLSTNKEVISKYHSESATITAHIDDGAGQTVAMKVYDSTQTTLLDTLSVTDIGGGDYTATYTAKGYGNVKIVAEYDSLQKSKTIEDCIYALLPQIDTPRNGTTYHLLNGDVISELPSTYSVEYEMKTSTAPTSSNEQRIYWVPTTLWTGSAQPSEAMFTGYCYSLKYEFGRRYNGSTTSTTYTGSAVNRWDKIKINKVDNNSRFDVYLNGTYKNNWTLNNAKNYSTWEFGFALWSNTTYSIQNIKIKPL